MKYADPITPGAEDKFCYVISEDCVMCGLCAEECPVDAISADVRQYEIDQNICIDCGTCSYVCLFRIPQPA